MNKSNNKIPPTITLAQLYEAQQQYFDAYMIYKKIYENNADESILERMEKSKSKIFIDPNMQYHAIIESIFTPEDKALFKILPDENYLDYQKSLKDEVEETEFVEEEFEEDEYDMSEAEEIEEIYNPTDLPPFEEFTTGLPETDDSVENHFSDLSVLDSINESKSNALSISDFCMYLNKTFGSDKKVADLTLSDLLKIFDKIKKS
jgi:hypothetical protein